MSLEDTAMCNDKATVLAEVLLSIRCSFFTIQSIFYLVAATPTGKQCLLHGKLMVQYNTIQLHVTTLHHVLCSSQALKSGNVKDMQA